MPKIGFLMPTAKNRFQILNLHPKKILRKNHGLKGKNYHLIFQRSVKSICKIDISHHSKKNHIEISINY